MPDTLTIAGLSRQTGVSSKTLRYWEGIGLLPRARRNHNGYRLFPPESVQYVKFVEKSKSVGLTLAEMKQLLALARSGKNPCPQVLDWIDQKSAEVEEQLRALQRLKRRLQLIRRTRRRISSGDCLGKAELCCLIEGLPVQKSNRGGESDAKALRFGTRTAGDGCR